MTQTDRIEALLVEVNAKLDLWLAGQKRTKKPSLTEEERDKIHSDYGAKFQGDVTEMDFQIELALQHRAAKKNSNMNLYVRNWLNTDMNKKVVKQIAPLMAERIQIDKYANQNLPIRQEK